ncbi:MAG: hypothetical protein H8D34_26840 [Chloroflexi bacterium]|nr:hypothetical protein [Chloroflexota bacterium]
MGSSQRKPRFSRSYLQEKFQNVVTSEIENYKLKIEPEALSKLFELAEDGAGVLSRNILQGKPEIWEGEISPDQRNEIENAEKHLVEIIRKLVEGLWWYELRTMNLDTYNHLMKPIKLDWPFEVGNS